MKNKKLVLNELKEVSENLNNILEILKKEEGDINEEKFRSIKLLFR